MPEPVENLTISNLAARLPGGRCLIAADSLQFRAGTLHAIIGPNGAGKTSLLRAMLGIIPATGQLRLGGISLHEMPTSRRVRHLGFQPQSPPLSDGLRVVEFVAAARGAWINWLTGPDSKDREAVAHALELVGATQLANRHFHTLSGGEIARVTLASTLAQGCRWLLLDEPAAALDAAAARQVYRLLARLVRDQRLSLVVVEHDLGLARSFADGGTLIAGGAVLADGEVEEVFTPANLEQAYGTAFEQVEVAPRSWAVVAVDRAATT